MSSYRNVWDYPSGIRTYRMFNSLTSIVTLMVVRFSALDITSGKFPMEIRRFCMSRKGGTWGGGWVQPRGVNGID